MSSSSSLLIPPVPEGATRKRNVLDVLEALSGSPHSKILIRVDFNVPMDAASGTITDDSRIRGALPTIQAVLQAGHLPILCSHMGRPDLVQAGKMDDAATQQQRSELSLKPIGEYLAKLTETTVLFADDCMNANDTIAQLTPGSICLLENLRFYKAEEKNDATFSQTLASYATAYINDAFGTCHRAHASTAGVPHVMDPTMVGIGALVASELAFLDFTNVDKNKDKISAIIGGSKVSTKLPVIQGLLKSCDVLVLGGGLAYTFLKALGIPIGSSLCEESMIETALELMDYAEANNKQMVLPVDAVCAASFPSKPMDKEKDTKTVEMIEGSTGIPDGWMGLDVGPKTIEKFMTALAGSTKLVFNGPMGVFEVVPFDEGTRRLVDGICDLTKTGTVTVVGGGDSVAALEAFGKSDQVSYVSTGGGATLELLGGDKLPGVEAIPDFV